MLRNGRVALVALVSSSSFVFSPAWADGMGSLKDTPAPVEDYVWDGLYVGVGLGAGSFDHSVDVKAKKTEQKEKCDKKEECSEHSPYWHPDPYFDPKMIMTSASFGDDDWHVFGTVQLGYDRVIHSRLLIGAFVDFDFYQDSDSGFSMPWINEYCDDDCNIGSIDGKIELDNVWSVGGRLGVLLRPNLLVYGVGGYTEANLDGSITVTFKDDYGDPTPLSLAAPDELQGYFIGGGAELKLRKNVSLKVEYRYSQFDGESVSSSVSSVSDPYCCYDHYCRKVTTHTADADFDADIHSVRAVLALKLGEPERPVEPLK